MSNTKIGNRLFVLMVFLLLVGLCVSPAIYWHVTEADQEGYQAVLTQLEEYETLRPFVEKRATKGWLSLSDVFAIQKEYDRLKSNKARDQLLRTLSENS